MNRDRKCTTSRLAKAGLTATLILILPTLSGCWPLPPPVPTVTTPETVVSTTPAPTASSVTAPATPTTPTKSTSSASKLVSITSTALAGFELGSPEADVVATLTGLLGKPTRHNEGSTCEIFADAPYGSWYTFGPLDVSFASEDAKPSSPRSLNSFGLPLSSVTDPRFAIAKDLPVTASFAQLKKQYPDGTSYDGPGDPPDVKFFELPDGNVTFQGDYYANDPDYMTIGSIGFCD